MKDITYKLHNTGAVHPLVSMAYMINNKSADVVAVVVVVVCCCYLNIYLIYSSACLMISGVKFKLSERNVLATLGTVPSLGNVA